MISWVLDPIGVEKSVQIVKEWNVRKDVTAIVIGILNRELFLVEKVKNNYRITEFDSLINTF